MASVAFIPLPFISGEFLFSDGQSGGEVLEKRRLLAAGEVSWLHDFVLTFLSGGCGHDPRWSFLERSAGEFACPPNRGPMVFMVCFPICD
jgi:hypothetical protein